MTSAAAIRDQVESALAGKVASALSPAPRAAQPLIPTGNQEIDAILEGGFAASAITELVGTRCSGRTTMAIACLAAITRSGNVGAWIDVSDALDPESVAANGVDLERLLWVRCGSSRKAPDAAYEVALSPSPPVAVHRHTGGGSPHPRSEARDMPEAISSMLRAHGGLYDHQLRREKRSVGTPGVPNRPLSSRSKDRVEQVNSDRLPPRRGDNLALTPRCAESQPRREAGQPSRDRLMVTPASQPRHVPNSNPWQALDQALRATDLLLQGGGFSLIVLDLGGTPPELAWRIPMATWFRFRAACERGRASLLLLTQHPCARSSAERVLRMETGAMESDGRVMTGLLFQASMERRRDHAARIVPIGKPPQPVRPAHKPGQWRSQAPWACAR